MSTEKRKFIISDTPGHEQYTGNAYDPLNGKTYTGTFLKLKGSKKSTVSKKLPIKTGSKKKQSGSGTAFFINKNREWKIIILFLIFFLPNYL